MEEQQIRDFVYRVSNDEKLRKELTSSPDDVLRRESFSPRVAEIVRRLVPHLAFDTAFATPLSWWRNT
ncbi:MAG TPA: hypothetical protein VGN15_09510 [Ktedonobacteraceae bacterium]|jgi:hypothetical protein|nr:hypothetical protein [Ktedonobacteraceae bacterium]